jgi:hypothetical protein
MRRQIHGPMLYRGSRRIISKKIIIFPVSGRPDRPLSKTAAAVRANILQHAVDTIRAERTLIGADTGLQGVRGQLSITVFTGGSEFEHVNFLLPLIKRS